MKQVKLAIIYLFCAVSPALAQWQVPLNQIPVGRGPGVSGFNTVLGGSGAGTKCLTDTVPPSFVLCAAGSNTVVIDSTAITGGTLNGLLYDHASKVGNLATGNNGVLVTDGSGVPSISTSLPSSLTAPAFTITGSFTATGLVTNADLVSPTITINSTSCTLGGSCTVGSALTAGTTIVNGGPGILQNTSSGGTLVSSATIPFSVTFGASSNHFQFASPGAGAFYSSNTTTDRFFAGTDASSDNFRIFTSGAPGNILLLNGATGNATLSGSLTLGSPLTLASGGTNAGLTASNGGIVYSNASALAILAGTVTAGQCLLSGSSTAPTWGACAGGAAVASVSDSGTGTLTISPTTGAVVAAINLGHFNTWTNKVGITTAVGTLNFDFETTGAVGTTTAQTAAQGKIFAGSVGSPITTAVPTIAISRYEAITTNTQGGENAALWIEVNGNNTSSPGVIAEVNPFVVKTQQNGSGDVAAGYFSSIQNGTNIVSRSSAGYGVFIATTANNSGNSVYGLENIINNSTGQDLDYATFASGGFNGVVGYEIAATGANLSTVALWVRQNCIVLICGTFDVGIGFNSNSIQTASIRDDSNAVTSYLLVGSHTNGIDTSFGVYSANAIKGTGFAFSNTGSLALNGSYSTSNGGLILLNSHATPGDTAIVLGVGSNSNTDNTSLYINFITPNAAAIAGTILRNDSAGTRHVSYNTTSDQRLKVDIGPFNGGLDRLMNIKVHKYHGLDYAGTDYDVGFFAQELYEQFPWAVTPSTDPDFNKRPWQVDYGRVTPLLVSAIQELEKRVEKLERK